MVGVAHPTTLVRILKMSVDTVSRQRRDRIVLGIACFCVGAAVGVSVLSYMRHPTNSHSVLTNGPTGNAAFTPLLVGTAGRFQVTWMDYSRTRESQSYYAIVDTKSGEWLANFYAEGQDGPLVVWQLNKPNAVPVAYVWLDDVTLNVRRVALSPGAASVRDPEAETYYDDNADGICDTYVQRDASTGKPRTEVRAADGWRPRVERDGRFGCIFPAGLWHPILLPTTGLWIPDGGSATAPSTRVNIKNTGKGK